MSQEATSNIQTANNKRKHSSCLTAFLALAIVVNSAFALMTWAAVPDVLSSNRPIVIFAGALNLACAGFAIAVYKWKEWGVYGYVSTSVVSAVINYIGMGFWGALMGILGIPIVLLLMRPVWNQMK